MNTEERWIKWIKGIVPNLPDNPDEWPAVARVILKRAQAHRMLLSGEESALRRLRDEYDRE